MSSHSQQHDLLAVADGDLQAFSDLYDAYAPRLLGLIQKVIGRRGEAEDVLQEVFREIWTSAGRFDPQRGCADAWLIMLARARAIDFLRRRTSSQSHERVAARLDGASPPPDADEQSAETGHAAGRALAILPGEQREAIGLAFYRGMTCPQIAEALDLPVGTVKTRIRLGMQKLRDQLKPSAEVSV